MRPFVTISVSRMPKDHTSDLVLNVPLKAASGAVHFMDNLRSKPVKDYNNNELDMKVCSIRLTHKY